jgi:lipopolysaccharide transport system permease protein
MQKTVITPKGIGMSSYLKDVWSYRQILRSFAYRNLRAQYAQTSVGILWALINPILALLVLGFIFGKVAKMDTQGIDPFLFTIVGLNAWTYFSNVVSMAGRSIIQSQNMVKKIYFPRILLPLSAAVSCLLDLVIVFLLACLLLLVNRYTPSSNLIYLPIFIVMIILCGAICGIWVSALGIRYRDFHHVVPFVLRIGLYASPVAYSLHSIESKYHLFFNLNPLTGILEGFRWCFFGGTFPTTSVWISMGYIIIFLITGLFYFNRVERTIADII